jgi:hypothetical protein
MTCGTNAHDVWRRRFHPSRDGFLLPRVNGQTNEDEGTNYNYEKGEYSIIDINWNDRNSRLEIGKRRGNFPDMLTQRRFSVHRVDSSAEPNIVVYRGERLGVFLK